MIFEVLSESTATTDRTTKLMEYRSLPTLKRYVLLEQAAPLATVITRSDTGWNIEVLDTDGTLSMPGIDVEIPMAELYDGLEFMPLNP